MGQSTTPSKKCGKYSSGHRVLKRSTYALTRKSSG